MKVEIRYEMIGDALKNSFVKPFAPLKRKKTYVASAYCVKDCKKFHSIDEKSKILYCNGGKE
jgi:hypothetical protein